VFSLAVDAPTIYDLGTAVVALLGLGLSAYSIRRQVTRETRTVRVECRYSLLVGPITSVAPPEMVTVEVVNDGHRPVELTGVGFELEDGRQPVIMPVASRARYSSRGRSLTVAWRPSSSTSANSKPPRPRPVVQS
jgi:hypothetical protein